VQTIGVVGFGTMGAGIADLLARAEYRVVAVDTDRARLESGLGHIKAFHTEGIRRGKTDSALLDAVLSRIRTATGLAELAGAYVVIEAVTEDEAVKADILRRLAEHVGHDCIVATNTSGLSVTKLATHVPRPGRFAGLHFFNPPQLMKLVEVVRSIQATQETVDRLVELAERIGRHPVVVKDRPGFLVNYLFIPYINQAIREYDHGLASAEDMATAVKLGLGYPMGPLQLADQIGLDTHLHATEVIYAATGEDRFAAPPLLRQLVAAGRLGDKTGSGLLGGSEGSA
jgi:3-hydroxybutyryl-CoA dehydrogenase